MSVAHDMSGRMVRRVKVKIPVDTVFIRHLDRRSLLTEKLRWFPSRHNHREILWRDETTR